MPYFWGECEFPISGNQLEQTKRMVQPREECLDSRECEFPFYWKYRLTVQNELICQDWLSKQRWMEIKNCCPSCRGMALKWWKIYHRQDNLKGRLNHGQLSAIDVWILSVVLNFVWNWVCNVSSFSLSVIVEGVDKLGLWVMPHYLIVLRIWMWEATACLACD